MDREQATLKIKTSDFVRDKEWIDPKRLGQAATEIADFALGQYEVGQRAERERIVEKMREIWDTGLSTASMAMDFAALHDELRAEPAESGE